MAVRLTRWKNVHVRARVISHALKDILTEGDKVIIMGHKRPDLDAIGAAIGVSRFALMNNLEAYVVLNDKILIQRYAE